MKVSSDPHHTFTSSPTGVDIPGKKNKDEFCFAISSKKFVVSLLVLVLCHHPCLLYSSVIVTFFVATFGCWWLCGCGAVCGCVAVVLCVAVWLCGCVWLCYCVAVYDMHMEA